MDWILIYFAIKYKGYFYDIYNALKNKEFIPLEEIEKIKEQIEKSQIRAITIIDDDYPESLKQIDNPPFVIFYKGNKNLLKTKAIMFTGEFSNELIDNFIIKSSYEIAKEHTLISNNFKDLDKKIINLFLTNNNNVILVSPNGLTDPLFNLKVTEQKDNLLIISECPDGVVVNKKRIHQRNRLAIGLSITLIIASSYKKSGIMNLVSFALEQGKDVYCYPGLQNENDGNNHLIKEGAQMITSVKAGEGF